MRSLDCFPPVTSSNGASKVEHPGMTRASILYAPTNARIALTVSGASQLARVAIRCWLAWMVPRFHTQPSIVVVVGHIVVLAADSRKPLFAKLCSNRLTLCWSSAMVFPPQYMSSASLATTPSSSKSPSTRHNSSSSAVSDPGIPIAERAYTRTPRKGVTTPQ